tara:strand:+ start:1098 stop:1481 length:384 start_codon:yes stop_codon:yes gene_type:complete
MQFLLPTIVASIPIMTLLGLFTRENFDHWFYNIQGMQQIVLFWVVIILVVIAMHVAELIGRVFIKARMYYPWFATGSVLILLAMGLTSRYLEAPQQAATYWLYITPVIFLVVGKLTSKQSMVEVVNE